MGEPINNDQGLLAQLRVAHDTAGDGLDHGAGSLGSYQGRAEFRGYRHFDDLGDGLFNGVVFIKFFLQPLFKKLQLLDLFLFEFFADLTYFSEDETYRYESEETQNRIIGEARDWTNVSIGFTYSGRF